MSIGKYLTVSLDRVFHKTKKINLIQWYTADWSERLLAVNHSVYVRSCKYAKHEMFNALITSYCTYKQNEFAFTIMFMPRSIGGLEIIARN